MRFGLWLSIVVLVIGPASADMPAGLRIMPRVYQEELPLLERRACWPDLTLVFLCRPSGCRASPAYPETDLR